MIESKVVERINSLNYIGNLISSDEILARIQRDQLACVNLGRL